MQGSIFEIFLDEFSHDIFAELPTRGSQVRKARNPLVHAIEFRDKDSNIYTFSCRCGMEFPAKGCGYANYDEVDSTKITQINPSLGPLLAALCPLLAIICHN
eukprot:GHVP01062840.1.p1 GENE.GHVP01062840.1~~GHVP01062840.1.p1  ORF type:complete len:102 (+),score=8.01 GHVP01062840.1:359-664(+)